MGCDWGPVNHVFFQLANMFLAFSYVVPNTLEGLFLLRFVLSAAGLFFVLWAWIILCSLDTVIWNLFFTVLNFLHVAYLLYGMRPIKFDEDNETVYKQLFQPLGVKRYQYRPLAGLSEVLQYQADECYAVADETCDRLTIVLDGSVEVSKAGQCLHYLKKFEFMDSPEWIAGTDTQLATFAVTLKCLETTSCLSWRRRPLQKLLRKDSFMKNIFDSLVGQDVTKKLFKSNAVLSDQGDVGQDMEMKQRKASFVYQPRDRRRTSII